MMFWWDKIKAQEKEIEFLKSRLVISDSFRNFICDIKDQLNRLDKKLAPAEKRVVSYTADAVAFSKSLQRFNKHKKCGGGSCQMYYLVPCKEIDSVANSEEMKKAV